MLKNHFKIAWRNLRKRKVFTAINILGLAIGFGSSILIYLFLNFHLSFDKLHKNADRIYRVVTEEHTDIIDHEPSVPPAFAKEFRDNYDYAEKVAKINTWEDNLLSIDCRGQMVQLKEDAVFAEPDFFEIMNFPLVKSMGTRTLDEPNTAYISESTSKKMFGDIDPLGKTFVLDNRETIEVIGVLQNLPKTSMVTEGLFISFKTLIPLEDYAAMETWNGITSELQCLVLLKPNQNIADIENTLLELPKKYRPNFANKHVYKLQPLADVHFNPDYWGMDPALLWVFGIIGLFLIIIASINFINISTAQTFTRSREIGVRKVLGSYRKHLFLQFLTETFIIGLFAMLLGVFFAAISLAQFNELFQLELTFDDLFTPKIFGFLFLVLVIVSFISGSYPGLLMSRIVPVLALKGKLNQKDTGGVTTRKVLVIAQFTISIALIAATIIISKQMDYAINSDLGYTTESIVMTGIPTVIEPVKIKSLKERFEKITGVKQASACLSSPGASKNDWSTNARYHNNPKDEEFAINYKMGDIDYLEVFEIDLLAGRNYFESDSIHEILVNKRFGEKLGITNPEEMLGKKFTANGGYVKGTIVGVVDNFHNANFREEISPAFIVQRPTTYNEIALKINPQNVASTLDQIRSIWSETFPGYIYEHRFMDERVAEQYQTEQRYLFLSKIFSALAIFIGCLGLYGLILFFVGQRTKEIGIRKVLGSNVRNILALFTVDFFKLILIAGVIAAPIVWYFMEQWLQGYTYRTEIHWWMFALAIISIMIITLLTISYQTIKIALTSPVKSLRTE
ncbi:ABC transporter permease [Flagellimonas onchidii]|uniref:ABC transporter permease n=1 Tax=Flagellimonas onchidii TaxID=2562684 RepID=UPI0010A613AD|nr:ABC transporter permease [Allomuricauda onchidii]